MLSHHMESHGIKKNFNLLEVQGWAKLSGVCKLFLASEVMLISPHSAYEAEDEWSGLIEWFLGEKRFDWLNARPLRVIPASSTAAAWSGSGTLAKQSLHLFETWRRRKTALKTLPEAQRTQSIESTTWVNLSARRVQNWFHVVFLGLVSNLATRWRHSHKLPSWPLDGTTCIGSKFDHKMTPLALVINLTTKWRHLH